MQEERTLIKQFQLSAGDREKTFSIYHGNLLADRSDCIGITAYEREETKGKLFQSFIDQHKNRAVSPRTLLAMEKNSWTSVSELKEKEQHILFIHTAKKTGEAIAEDEFISLLKMTFASIAAYTYEKNTIKTIALPVLFRKGIKGASYETYIRLFVKESLSFLQKSEPVDKLHLYIWHKHDADKWLHVLNDYLQRPDDSGSIEETIITLRREIAEQVQSSFYQKLLPPWLIKNVRKSFTQKEIKVDEIVRAGDQLINRLVQALTGLYIVSSDFEQGSIFQRILRLKTERILIEWFADYFLFIKQSRYEIKNSFPSQEYALRYMMILSQIIAKCEEILNEENLLGKGHNG